MMAAIRLAPACSGVLPSRPATTRSSTRAVRFFPGKKGGGQGQAGTRKNLSLCRSDPVDKWWVPQLRPEDLVEPTGHGAEEMEAIQDNLVREPLRPICLALQEILATGGNLFRCRCFHAGLVTGALLLVAGLCQLYKVAPNLFMDIVLGYMFYKLSVLAADLKRNGKANTICARLQWVLIVILFHKYNNPTKDFYFHYTELICTY
ncbi:hypothetical protein U9M48_008287 [Paspalum notatum var. saurae]|uniref:Uncharacterized protein n=1 Tax=Paspalum notatum var. saurae TaxID=547442 RepID=A0AAQ3SPG2_PASNO